MAIHRAPLGKDFCGEFPYEMCAQDFFQFELGRTFRLTTECFLLP